MKKNQFESLKVGAIVVPLHGTHKGKLVTVESISSLDEIITGRTIDDKCFIRQHYKTLRMVFPYSI